jgi:hypothetical protein
MPGRRSSLEKTSLLCQWLKEHTQEPRILGSVHEVELANWLYYRRRKVKSGWKLPKEESSLLISNGLTELFSKSAYDLQDTYLTISYQGWVAASGREPGNNPHDPKEYHLYRWMLRKRGTEVSVEILNRSLIPNMFDKSLSRNERNLYLAQQVVDWYLQNGAIPSSKAEGNEGILGKWLSNKRTLYRKKGLLDPVAVLLQSMGLIVC